MDFDILTFAGQSFNTLIVCVVSVLRLPARKPREESLETAKCQTITIKLLSTSYSSSGRVIQRLQIRT